MNWIVNDMFIKLQSKFDNKHIIFNIQDLINAIGILITPI